MSESILQQVRDATAAYYAAFTTQDFGATMAFWSRQDDVFCIAPLGPPAFGHAQVADLYRASFAAIADNAFAFDVLGVSFDDPLATVVCEERIGDGMQTNIILATSVFRLEAGGWRMSHHHASWRSVSGRHPFTAIVDAEPRGDGTGKGDLESSHH